MKGNYDRAFRFTSFYEGFSSDLRGDPGGHTIWGICEKYWPADVARMKGMSPSESMIYAMAFHKKVFWDTLGCDGLPQGLDIVIFDIGVNQGPGVARAVLSAARNWWDALILRIDKWDDLDKLFPRFGKGWDRRACSLRDYITSDFTVLEKDRKELVKAKGGME